MRIATSFIANLATQDFQRAQIELFRAQQQAGSERKATDLKGYERDAAELISARGLLDRADSYVSTGTEILNRISFQDIALGRAAEASGDLKIALTEAIGIDVGDGLMDKVQQTFFNVLGAMETSYAGKYVFGGVREDASPMNITTLDDLEAALAVDDIFVNADRRAQVQVDPNTSMDLAPLASEVAREIFASLKRIKEYETANGPFVGQLTAAQRTFIEGEIVTLAGVTEGLNQQQSYNGGAHERAESLIARQSNERSYLEGVVSDIQSADLAEVAARLSQAQLQLEASARVFSVLNQASILNFI